MIPKLQTTDPERLGKEEDRIRDACISLGGGNRIDFMGRLRKKRMGAGDQVSGEMGVEREM